MGRATRWFKELFFGTPIQQNDKIRSSAAPPPPPPAGHWSHNPNITPDQAAWLTSFYSEPDTQQGIRARAVAAATAAAADAAVAAAQAAFEVVRLTSHAQGPENWAAVNIQRVFRGFLARKAHRALKGLVRIQALVRGFLVRKQAAATLHGMEALVRTQAALRAKKINDHHFKFPLQFQPPKSSSLDKPAEEKATSLSHSKKISATSTEESPKIVEVDTWCRPKSRSSKKVINKWISDSIMVDDHHPQLECRSFSSAQSTPRWPNSESFLGCPNYMVNTQAFRAKVRSQSAPKQRSEPRRPTKRASLGEVMGARISLSGEIRTKGHHHPQQPLDFKNAVMGKLRMN